MSDYPLSEATEDIHSSGVSDAVSLIPLSEFHINLSPDGFSIHFFFVLEVRKWIFKIGILYLRTGILLQKIIYP